MTDLVAVKIVDLARAGECDVARLTALGSPSLASRRMAHRPDINRSARQIERLSPASAGTTSIAARA
jgi:hypothetical protein